MTLAISDATRLSAQQVRSPRGRRCAVHVDGALVLYGDSIRQTTFDLSALRSMPSQEINAADHDGKASRYRGVTLRELFTVADGAKDLRSGNLAQYAVAEARDGYRAVLALAEIDPVFHSTNVIVAYEMNGVPLDTATGPLQLVVEGDQKHGRWVRQLECVRIRTDRP